MILSKIPIRFSAPIILALPVLTVALVLMVIAHTHAKATTGQLASQILTQIHDQVENHVSELLFEPSRVIHINRGLLELGFLSTTDIHSWRDVLITESQSYPMLSAIAWGGVDGQSTWISRYAADPHHVYYAILDLSNGQMMDEYRVQPDGRLSDEPTATFEFYTHTRPWYKTPVTAGGSTWCEPFVWVGGEDVTEITVGIAYGELFKDQQGKVLGVIDADLSLPDISKFLQGLKVGKTGRVFIIDEQGLLIATSSSAALATNTGQRIKAIDSQQNPIASAAHAVLDNTDSSTHGRILQRTIDIDDIRHLLMASPFEHPTGLKWTILTLIPESDFMEEIQAGRRRSLIFAVLAVLLMVVLGVLLAGLMIRPMIRLTSHVRHIGQGDFDTRIDMTWSPELVQLSGEINEMTAGLKDRVRLRRSLQLAMEVQQNLLPDYTPDVTGLDIAGLSNYCDETGGDYYDYLDVTGLDQRHVAIALGDVMGHGVAAAMLMATARGILRSRACETGSLAQLLIHLNDLLVDVTKGTRFMTMLLMTIDGKGKQIRWASAGHDAPFLYDRQMEQFRELPEEGGVPLGIMASQNYKELTVDQLSPGSIVVVATDGVWEAQDASDQMYGKDRLRQVIAEHHDQSAQAISDAIYNDLENFTGDSQQMDDITFVVVKFN